MAYPKEPIHSIPEGLRIARTLMATRLERGILRAFTLHLNPKPGADDLVAFADLAREQGFTLHVGRPVYLYGPDNTVVFLYSVLLFFNDLPVTA